MGWPPEGPLHLQAVRLVWNVVTGSPSYQFPYASHWLILAPQPFPCLKIDVLSLRVFMVRETQSATESPSSSWRDAHSAMFWLDQYEMQEGPEEMTLTRRTARRPDTGTFSPLGKARQALSEASIPASTLYLREAQGSWYRQREEVGEGKCPHPRLWYIFSSPSVIHVIRRPQTLFYFPRSCKPLSACWKLFIHTSWCGMIASSSWPPHLRERTESNSNFGSWLWAEQQDIASCRGPGRADLPIHLTHLLS